MKKTILFIAFAAMTFIGKGQITLENTYPNGIYGIYRLSFTYLSSGLKYTLIDAVTGQLVFYNIDHSIFKTINIPSQGYSSLFVNYVSENLFDLDSTNIEYVLHGEVIDTINSNNFWWVKIYREDGTLLFSKDSVSLASSGFISPFDKDFSAIYPSKNGYKMMLYNYFDYSATVYSLPGTLPNGFMKAPDGSNNADLSYPFPNPSSNSTRIEYKLPNGVRNGEVVFYNLNGREVKRYKVDNTFDSLQLNNSDLPSGTYLYHLITPNNGVSSPKKMVVIK